MINKEGMLGSVIRGGFIKGLQSGWFLVRITVPLSLLVSLLNYFGFLKLIAAYFIPAMKLFGLPGEAVFPLLSGAALNLYSGIAVLTSMPDTFSLKHLNIIAVMMLISHNLIIETAIQRKCGINTWIALLSRLTASVAAGVSMNLLIKSNEIMLRFISSGAGRKLNLSEFFLLWLKDVARLVLTIFIIILSIMIVYELMKHYKILEKIAAFMRPIMKLLSLSHDVTFLWLATTLVGLGYGGGIIISEISQNKYDRNDIFRLHLSIGISHSLLEDTLLLVAIGASVLWLIIPRLILSIIAVQISNLFLYGRLQNKTNF